jgi:2-keto-4-pentenoate hydratase/2-oxohepta-3-ene-1,7-dioic acid hydratase in catechol pathway
MRFGTVLRDDGVVVPVLARQGDLVDLAALAALWATKVPAPGRVFVTAWESGDADLVALVHTAMSGNPADLPLLFMDSAHFLPPVPDAATVLAVGLNYLSHCAEQGKAPPITPMFFAKLASSLSGHGAPIPAWHVTAELDFEGELAVIIGRGGRAIPEAQALDHVFGYTILNDVTARDLQRNDRQWTRAKGLDGFAPMGPLVVTRDEIPDPQALHIRTWVNGELRQDGTTDDMAFSVARIVAIASEAITLRTGDVITTGTPSGVGVYDKPPRFLVPGDVVQIKIDGIGELQNTVGAVA